MRPVGVVERAAKYTTTALSFFMGAALRVNEGAVECKFATHSADRNRQIV